MAVSLSFLVMGLMVAYALYNVQISPTKTLNAVLFDNVTAHWAPFWSRSFILTTLVSEAALLFVAAQTGFIDGPRIMANMAIDKWFPKKIRLPQRPIGHYERGIADGYFSYFTHGSFERFSCFAGSTL